MNSGNNVHFILICNTYPYSGEAFLHNELMHLPDHMHATVFPVLAPENAANADKPKQNIDIQKIRHPRGLSFVFGAMIRSAAMLAKTGEYKAAFARRGVCRNLLKSLRFAYKCERSIQGIYRWILDNDIKGKTVFYAYWLYHPAYIAARLHERMPESIFVSRCHGFDLYENRHPNGYLPYRDYLLKSVDMLFPISEDGKQYISKLFNAKWDAKIHVMRLGSNDCGLNPSEGDGTFTLVSCSNLIPVKRVDRIIEMLSDYERPIRWIHFGEGPLREELALKASELPPNVEWHMMGLVPNDEIMRFYRETHVDAFINVSESEGVPVSIMEAMSFGIPVIATDVGGTHEIVEDGVNGYLIEPDFRKMSLIQQINDIACIDIAKPMRIQARMVWKQRYNADSCYRTFYDCMQYLKINNN